ncbi:isochorismatase family protein [Brevibacillus brevis]|uniref:Isochorismatase family protein n=2 Tax=Bacteria TaxID=2 RepID=A0ABY9T5S9_BREBE|nr:isochorismatase family protein [Brevibacillus brevis]WNC15455.1 isochorismatase family protein [Brevibacillus brevis]
MESIQRQNDLQNFRERGFGQTLGIGNRPCVLVVDVIKGFTDPAMPLGSDLSRQIEVTNRLLREAHQKNLPVFFTTIAYEENLEDSGIWLEKMGGLKTLKSGTDAVQLDPRLHYQKGDVILNKKYASAFFGTDLISRLNVNRVDTVIVTGCTTSGCVRASVVDALQYGYRPIVVRDAVGDRSLASHDQSLFDMEQKYADVLDASELIAYMQSYTAIS